MRPERPLQPGDRRRRLVRHWCGPSTANAEPWKRQSFDLACDRGDYSLEQQCNEICSRIRLTCTPIEIARFWAEAFSPRSDVLAVSQVRATAVTAMLTNNGPLVRLMINEYFPDIAARVDCMRSHTR